MKLLIYLESNDKRALDNYTLKIKNYLNGNKIKYDIIIFPKTEKKITLLKSPHIYKKAKVSYKIVFHKKTIRVDYLNKSDFVKMQEILKNIGNDKIEHFNIRLEVIL